MSYALEQGYNVRACTRSGKLPSDFSYTANSPLEAVRGDVTDIQAIKTAIQGCSGVVFAASASQKKEFSKKDNAMAVDFEGVVNAAKACVELKIPRFIVVSSGGVSKPDSSVYKFLNLFGK